MSLAESVHQTLHQLSLSDRKLLVGVSGGADSLALLHILHADSRLDIHAATLDHGLRGADGAADVRFVIQTCAAWGIPVTAGARQDLPTGADVENAARAARYDFLAQVAHEVGARHVIVAHHADDQAETVLMHLIRGTGLQGLAGMTLTAPLPGHPDLMLIRPLLRTTRREIDTYCRAHDLRPRQDATNQDTTVLRNRIRLETMPYLRQINPQIDAALNRFAAIAAQDQVYIRQQLADAVTGQVTIDTGRVTLPRALFHKLHPALQAHFVVWAAGQIGGPDVGYEAVTQALALANTGRTGQQRPLVHDLRLRIDYETVVIEQTGTPLSYAGPLLPADAVLPVAVPGVTALPGGHWRLYAQAAPETESPDLQAHLSIPPGAVIELRTRRPGDRFAPVGMNGHTKSIKAWMIDQKIPRSARAQIPLLTINGIIAAIIRENQWNISEEYAHQQDDSQGIYFRLMNVPPT